MLLVLNLNYTYHLNSQHFWFLNSIAEYISSMWWICTKNFISYLNFGGSLEIICTRARLSSPLLTSLRFLLLVMLTKVISKNNFPSSEAANSAFLVNCFYFFYLKREQEEWFKDFGCLHLHRKKAKHFAFQHPEYLEMEAEITQQLPSPTKWTQPESTNPACCLFFACGMICCSPLTFVLRRLVEEMLSHNSLSW